MDKPIRILHVFGKLNRGGAETMIMDIYRNIDRTKVQFDFVVHTKEKCDYDNEIQQLGGKIFRIPAYKGYNHYSYIKKWKKIITNHKEYHIVHGHIRSTASIYLSICKKYNMITISHSHSTSNGEGNIANIKNIMQYPIRNIADYFFAASKNVGRWLFGNAVVNNKNFFVVKNAIDSKKFSFNRSQQKHMRKKLNIEKKFVVGHVGRFNEVKNHKFLLEVFKEVVKKNKDSKLLLIGGGELERQIKQKIDEMNLKENVILTGVRPDVYNLMQAMDVFLFPSFYEGLPLTLIEAQASGLKVIASDTITKKVAITNNVDFMSIKDQPAIWAEKILTYRNYTRKIMSSEISQAGYDVKDNISWFEDFYIDQHRKKIK